jgi:hypothetical protein
VPKRLIALVPSLLLAATVAVAAGPATKPAARPTAQPATVVNAKPPRAAQVTGKARVGGGTIVPHYGSAWRADELATLRPNYQALKPRARTNQE